MQSNKTLNFDLLEKTEVLKLIENNGFEKIYGINMSMSTSPSLS